MIAKLAEIDQDGRRDLAWKWMAKRDPGEAAREILRAAVPMPPLQRWVAADVTELLGSDTLPTWREMLSEPNMAVHARCALYAWDEGPELTEGEWLWLAVESAAAGLSERGPDEALCRIWERVPGDGLDDRLASVRATSHPSADSLAAALSAFAGSGATLTVNQGLRLKVALKHARPPIWRSVVVPSMVTLGDLHQVIQVLFGWDGDHMHMFQVGRRRYSNHSFGMEGTGDEVEVRVRDAFGTERKISYEYDFGAEWTHEITVQKTVPLDPGATYPVCVSFSGESPEEYPEEDWESDEYDEDL
jgi:hypothetical protein